MSLSKRLRKQIEIALGSKLFNSANKKMLADELMGVVGIKGGFACNADGSVMAGSVTGDMKIEDKNSPGLGLAAGQYRMRFNPKVNSKVQSLLNVKCRGFTPRSPSAAETCDALITGWGQDSEGWYITIVVATLSNMTITATPPANFVVGIDVSFLCETGLDYNNY